MEQALLSHRISSYWWTHCWCQRRVRPVASNKSYLYKFLKILFSLLSISFIFVFTFELKLKLRKLFLKHNVWHEKIAQCIAFGNICTTIIVHIILLILSEIWSKGSNLTSLLLANVFSEVAQVNAEALDIKFYQPPRKHCRGSAEVKFKGCLMAYCPEFDSLSVNLHFSILHLYKLKKYLISWMKIKLNTNHI